MTTDLVLQQVRSADPLDPSVVAAWPDPATARRVLLRATSSSPARPVRRRRALPVAVLVGALVGGTGVAVATGVLGGPAPDAVKGHLAELDRGIPADLRYDPDLEHARAVAFTAGGALYLADLADGGYCLEVATASQPRGASCVPEARVAGLPLDVIAPLPASAEAALLVGGRANDARIASLRVRFADGSASPVTFGLDRSWLLEIPSAHRAAALASGLVVQGLDKAGTAVTTVQVPALRDDDHMGTAHDAKEPLVLTTTSDGDDLTQVLGIQGRVNLTGRIRLEVRFPDGTRLAVPVGSDGSYDVTFAADRRDDFATAAGSLVALRDGQVVATRPIGSVALWRARNG